MAGIAKKKKDFSRVEFMPWWNGGGAQNLVVDCNEDCHCIIYIFVINHFISFFQFSFELHLQYVQFIFLRVV
jgi:hypothetical protein